MTDYRQKSDSVLSYIKNQLSSFGMWTNVPGALNKISSSAGGYTWGISSDGKIFSCKEPCSSADWKSIVSPSGVNIKIVDVATDSQYVYILYQTDENVVVPVPSAPEVFAVGDSYQYTQEQANGVCQQYNSTVATLGQLEDAQQKGADWCFTAWVSDSPEAKYPISTTVIPGCASAPGIQTYNPGTAGVNCYGPKPPEGTPSIRAFNASIWSIQPSGQTKTELKTVLKYARMNVDGSGSWESYDAQGDGTNIEVSDAFLFIGTKGCAKPCTTGNWVDVPQPGGTGINQGTFSASPGNVYNLRFENGVYKTYKGTGTGQGGWVELPGLQNKFPLSTSTDNTAIYATPADSGNYGTLERCEYPYDTPEKCKKVFTDGRTATSVSVNPATSRVWMTTKEMASKGNIFQRLDSEDPQVIMNEFGEREQELQRDVNSLGGDIRLTHAEVSAGMTRKEASDIITEATNLSGNISGTLEESEKLRSQIRQGKKEEAGYKNKMLPLQILTFTLAVVLLLYLTAGIILPSSITSILAVLGLSAGLGSAIYFAVTNK